jgi:hypothetical protein
MDDPCPGSSPLCYSVVLLRLIKSTLLNKLNFTYHEYSRRLVIQNALSQVYKPMILFDQNNILSICYS